MTAISSTTDDEFLTSLGIKSAKPFNWSIDEQQANTKPIKSTTNVQSSIPSGFDVIKNFIHNNSNNDTDKQILQSLLKDANVNLPSTHYESTTHAKSNNTIGDDFTRDLSIKGLSDRAVAEHTLECKTSLFGSILRLFDQPNPEEEKNIKSGLYNKHKKKDVTEKKKDNDVIMKDTNSGSVVGVSGVDTATTTISSSSATTDTSTPRLPLQPAATAQVESSDPMIMTTPILSTAEIVRSVHLSAKPGDIPLSMDSKEYTLAVLSFLSSYIPYLHENESEYIRDTESQEGWQQLRDTLPILPLLKATNPDESLELRCYGRVKPLVKLGQTERKDPDTMDSNDIRKKVLNLESIFSSSLPYAAPSSSERLTAKLSEASSTKVSISTEEAEKKEATETSLPSFEKYCPRRKLVPHIDGGYKEELTLMISGHMQQPQHTPGPTKGKKSKSPATVGKEKDSAKRKVDTASDDSLHQSKKAKGIDI